METRPLLDGAQIAALIERLASEVAASVSQPQSLALVGLPTRGVTLARRLADRIGAITGSQIPPVGQIDITFHRDDLSQHLPIPHQTEIPFDPTGKTVLLVDDVLFTGRTTRAALDALNDFGRPAAIRLLALVDRGHRQLPIQADFVGAAFTTSLADRVTVHFTENDGHDSVLLQS
ncbi:pyrimidine operon attenuation protein / uracil phosphoribosyltransferase [Verrucomicrobium sp. GAS474]|uniref:bifunctional pyr operon transcriptional regulator/uracil phosphoribosyltransferase PyrR n=1 Tax=Verrucomicrobium sp. GAS474 TaxID=1882831 RepID=UPI00087C7B74|nr:bifunctional pyr operon transcriptional regulator/uracil phosphoribosyltransferase PyrR [Verrucomicrobium sp. GAS474]SDU28021.1 pyrimidine operon attenuation protein / uracil phosphoribosyltransferase [Verrucomicrobium sp. GAS474]